MRTRDIVNLACNAVSDPTDPSKSCLLLQQYQAFRRLPQLDKLTGEQVSVVHTAKARIASCVLLHKKQLLHLLLKGNF
jgi:hypothetical protein